MYEGKAVVTFQSVDAVSSTVSVSAALFDESLKLVDYITPAIDRLFPRKVWFTGFSSNRRGCCSFQRELFAGREE